MANALKNQPDLKFPVPREATARPSLHPARRTPPAAGSRNGKEPDRSDELQRLYRALSDVTPETHPRTARLLASSTRKTAQKVIEEAGEVALEAVRHHPGAIVRESADLLYHLVALWHRAGIDPQDVWSEMRFRADMLGIAEKRPKKSSEKFPKNAPRRAAIDGRDASQPCNSMKQSRTRS